MNEPILLPGLDALDPLAFLAALGCLAAATDRACLGGLPAPRLRFELGGRITPVLSCSFADLNVLVDELVADLDVLAGRRNDSTRDEFLAFSYEDEKGQPVQDLKPPPQEFREFAEALVDRGASDSRRALDWTAATLTDVATDGPGSSLKPFSLHFTAGQQRFLAVAQELMDGAPRAKPGSAGRRVDAEDIRNAIVGPWPNDRVLKVFSWSPTQERAYALRAVDPSTDPKLGTPGADWLALRGVVLLSSAPVSDKIRTGGVHGGWKSATFSYPVWPTPLCADAVRSLLRHPDLRPDVDDTRHPTLPRGTKVLTCRISRSAQGGYGSFSRPTHR